MRLASNADRTIVGIVKFLGLTLAAGVVYVAVREVPGILRYIKINRIAKGKDGASSRLLPSPRSPQYAQAPRRFSEANECEPQARRANG